ncbi:hypothetical protein DJ66_0263 [Candidatus Liberibacter solanacearum]|uniref:Uncharacterized protein n=1 Tax=Candidatus Liberibacter solanacearum TaxID=556287 RepID=A0A0F4VMQ4_9HYPH|nr:hypothetical protein DJ66_0263 [Candidatus Liberibacter solanacearum]
MIINQCFFLCSFIFLVLLVDSLNFVQKPPDILLKGLFFFNH